MYYTGKDMKMYLVNSKNKAVTVEAIKNSLIYAEFTSVVQADFINIKSDGYNGVKGINNKSQVFSSSTDVSINYYID
jgi:hypothetical protein